MTNIKHSHHKKELSLSIQYLEILIDIHQVFHYIYIVEYKFHIPYDINALQLIIIQQTVFQHKENILIFFIYCKYLCSYIFVKSFIAFIFIKNIIIWFCSFLFIWFLMF